ncbi:transglycosylase domain-containing protein [Sporolactobacillus sp. THM19-2]|jgi:penicillin-binding protein|uniref:transglycosylase domain-containing protein n=1 Tax=Sporolactobacillus sp. THM19-2 TaxID=2511171 RepID=UPI00102073CD|nr:transglycosylase domain-containing protein [Sporolactobacillus sp. THM19-2]RYL94568.1 penicillin-binding protein [Sporolactobacillus sp. THM19-2]
MRFKLKRFSRYFDRLAEIWSTNRVIQTLESIRSVIWHSFLMTLSLAIIGCFFAAGTVSGYFAKVVHNQALPSYDTMQQKISNYSESSIAYFAGNIPIGKLNSDLVRTKTDLQDISPNLIHAVIATEDELFYQHHGVVPRAVIRASTEELLNQPQVTGGSSITQQLVKNQMLTNEVSIDRKFKEILLALRLEKFFSKDEILNAYLNMAPFGRDASGKNIAGVAAASEGIFNVKADRLNIPQAAFVAGLPKNPFTYSPFLNQGGLKKDLSAGINRAHTVLRRMHSEGYIDSKQLKSALAYDYRKHFAQPAKSVYTDYPYLSKEVEHRAAVILAKKSAQQQGYSGSTLYQDYLNYERITYEKNHVTGYTRLSLQEIAKKDGLDYETVENHYKLFTEMLDNAGKQLGNGGFRISTTINKPIYDGMQAIARGYSRYGPEKYARKPNGEIITVRNAKTGKDEKVTDPMQVGSIMIDNKTGKIISFVGGRDFGTSQYNFATSVTRQNGSTMKPLLVYAPAMEMGLIQPGSVVADLPYRRTINGKIYAPTDYGSTSTSSVFHGFETARKALAASHNVPAVSVFTRLSKATDKAPDFLKKMGVTSLVGTDGHNVSAALGGITRGLTVEENTNAYTTFANNGQFIDAYMIDKITDASGKVIYQHESKPVRVFSEQTNYLMLDMMRDVFKYGTGARMPGGLEFTADWAGKTGTSQNWRDSWLVASNPNITLGVWNGYAHNQQLNRYTYSDQTRSLFTGFANSAYHVDPDLMAPKEKFSQPGGVVRATACGLTGQKPTGLCQAAGFVTTDLMNKKYLPAEDVEPLIPANAPQPKPDEQQEGKEEGQKQEEKDQKETNPEKGNVFRIKPEIMSDRFPYTDLKSANPKLLGKIRP